jgi:acyl-CoA synthetase (NDP forming)
MGDDPRIKIIASYLEGVDNGSEFLEISRKVAKTKPVLGGCPRIEEPAAKPSDRSMFPYVFDK